MKTIVSQNHIKTLHVFRMAVVIIAGVTTILFDNIRVDRYLIYFLLFIANTQFRIRQSQGKWFLLSILGDYLILFFIFGLAGGVNYILIVLPLLDISLFTPEEARIASLFGICMVAYFMRNLGVQAVIGIAVLYVGFSVLLRIINRLSKELVEVEVLYDRIRRYSYELEGTKKRLENYSRKVEHISQLEERNYIAREIHDTIGHKLMGVLMQIEATIRVMPSDSEKGMQLLNEVRDNLNASVELMRQTVRRIRPRGYSSKGFSIQKMIGDFQRDTGVNINFAVDGQPVKLFPSIELTLYQNTQEAMTNAVRHGKASQIDVELKYVDDQVTLIIRDNGKGCEQIVPGMGLSGMQERVTLLGGRIEFESKNGFLVRTIISL